MRFRNLSFSCGLVVASIVFSLVRPRWVGIWVGIEINLFGAITLLVNNKKRTVDSGFKYFFAQSFGSRVIIMRLVIGRW